MKESKLLFAVILVPLWGSSAKAQCPPQEVAKLVEASAFEAAGGAVAFCGDTLAVAASGSVYLYERDEGGPDQWGLVTVVTGTGGFGAGLDLWEDRMVVGASSENGSSSGDGAAFVYERDEGGVDNWGLVKKIVGVGTAGGDLFGYSVSVHDNWVAVGAPNRDAQFQPRVGAVFFFERDLGGPGNWGQSAEFKGATQYHELGSAIGIGAKWAVVSGDLTQSRLYELTSGGTQWTLLKKLNVSPALFIGSLFGYVGSSSAVHGDTVLVGSRLETVSGLADAGAVYVFERNKGGPKNFGLVKKLVSPAPQQGNMLGSSVALTDDTIIAGAPDGLATSGKGAAFLYQRASGWSGPATIVAADGSVGDRFGSGVALSGTHAVIGAPRNDAVGVDSGSAYVYFPTLATPTNYCYAGTTSSGCNASLSGAGVPSASTAGTFVLTVSNVEGQRPGLIYFGTQGTKFRQWGNGSSFQCVVPPVTRTGSMRSGGNAGSCDGSLVLDFNVWMQNEPTKAPRFGDTVNAQAWFRDPQNTSQQKTALSDGLRFAICP
jgi:hypothetical protein